MTHVLVLSEIAHPVWSFEHNALVVVVVGVGQITHSLFSHPAWVENPVGSWL